MGFLHRPRPGRQSLALDLMEELRTVYADRFVLSCVNQKILTAKDLQRQESGAVWLTDEGRRAFFKAWQSKKQEQITHPFLREKLPWGLVPLCASPCCWPAPCAAIWTYIRPFSGSEVRVCLYLSPTTSTPKPPPGANVCAKVAKACVNHGQRVQNSVFECLLDAAQYTAFKASLAALIDPETDSLRFYQLGNHYKTRVEHLGRHPEFAQDDVLLV